MTIPPADSADLRLRAAVESAPSGLLMTDARGVIVLVNREIERLFGYPREELLGRHIELLVPARFREGHADLRGGFLGAPRIRAMGAGRDLHGVRKDGTEVPVEIGLTPVATEEGMFVLASVVDISARKGADDERRRLEEQLRQSQRLEALGTLAGGIAHDFNNILFGITAYAELMGKAASPEEAAADLSELQRAAARGRELIDRILAFSRREPVARRPLELGPTVAEAAALLRATLGPAIDLQVNVHPQVPRVLGDPTSVHQVLMNLGTNAAQAMPGGGVLTIGVEPRYLRDSAVRSHPGLHEGPYVLLEVRDTGTGMEHAVREHAFEPFYTTKARGSGTGLGLSIVHSIMQAHDGAVTLASERGKGTTVTCFFPALTPSPAEERRLDTGAPAGRGERVLVVEDEPSLAAMTSGRLEALGYRVSLETDGERALATFRERPAAFDLVVSDHLMPGVLGLDLAREIHGLRPGVPILLLTGRLEHASDEAIRSAGVRKVLQKPVTLGELGRAVRDLLGGTGAGE